MFGFAICNVRFARSKRGMFFHQLNFPVLTTMIQLPLETMLEAGIETLGGTIGKRVYQEDFKLQSKVDDIVYDPLKKFDTQCFEIVNSEEGIVQQDDEEDEENTKLSKLIDSYPFRTPDPERAEKIMSTVARMLFGTENQKAALEDSLIFYRTFTYQKFRIVYTVGTDRIRHEQASAKTADHLISNNLNMEVVDVTHNGLILTSIWINYENGNYQSFEFLVGEELQDYFKLKLNEETEKDPILKIYSGLISLIKEWKENN